MTKSRVVTEKVNLIFVVAILFGLIIRVVPDGRSLWFDELYSVVTAYKYGSFHDLWWGRLVREIHPPLYQIILYYWVILFGDSEYVVRLPSVLAGVSLVLFVYFYGRKLLDKSQALLLTALLAVSWGGIFYAHEARSYSLLLMLSAVLMLKSLQWMTFRSSIPVRQMLEMFILGLLLCHTHYFGALLWFSNLIALMAFLNLSRLKVIALAFVSMLAFVPWMILNSGYIEIEGGSWIGQLGRDEMLLWFVDLVTANIYVFWMLAALILYRLFFQFKPLLAAASNGSFHYSVSVLFLAGLFAVLINRLYMPIITARNMIIVLPFLYMIISTWFTDAVEDEGHSRGWLFRIPPAYVSACLVLVMLGSSLFKFVSYEKEDWRGSAASVARIRNLERVYFIGEFEKYWHYLRRADFNKDKMTQALEANYSAPEVGSVSVLWHCSDPVGYERLKQTLTEMRLETVDEIYFNREKSCAYTVFK
ncbi:MAG: glycosyltransferase family 39 protein [Pseudomonadota bacterium]